MEFCRLAALEPTVEVWLFGSAKSGSNPRDLDILVIYELRGVLQEIREAQRWDQGIPPLHITAMTKSEESHYSFIEVTGAIRIA